MSSMIIFGNKAKKLIHFRIFSSENHVNELSDNLIIIAKEFSTYTIRDYNNYKSYKKIMMS